MKSLDSIPNIALMGILITGTAALASGGRLLLLPELVKLTNSIGGMFRKFAEQRRAPVAPGTLGILCDATHLALGRYRSQPILFRTSDRVRDSV